jgi:pimeloyl-ACP methyl ester carboxylesterase
VVDHAGAAHTAGRTVDAGGAALAARVRRDDSAGARLYSRRYRPAPAELAELRSAITRRDGAAFLHNAAGFVSEHRRLAQHWDLAQIARDLDGTVALYVGGSDDDAYEHRQFQATRERVPQAEILTFPGGHLTTSEHPDRLAATIRDIAERHGVGTPAPG